MFVPLVLLFLHGAAAAIDKDTFRSLLPFRECLGKSHPGLCLKERALAALDEAMTTEKPFVLFDIVEIARNPAFRFNSTDNFLPEEASARNLALSDVLYTKVEDFFKSRVIKFNMAPAFDEGK